MERARGEERRGSESVRTQEGEAVAAGEDVAERVHFEQVAVLLVEPEAAAHTYKHTQYPWRKTYSYSCSCSYVHVHSATGNAIQSAYGLSLSYIRTATATVSLEGKREAENAKSGN